MSSGGHLEEGDLLRLIDGELPDETALGARSHIEACWTCRSHFHEIETAIGEYVRYQKTIDPWLPAPPSAWPELHVRPQLSVPLKPPGLLLSPSRRWFDVRWAIAVAALLFTAFTISWLQRPRTLAAGVLLRKASAVERLDGSIRIRVKNRVTVRPAVLRNAGREDAELRSTFERAHFNWEQPLSARTFAAWHDQLAEKQDTVTLEKNGASGDHYVIRTSTQGSELHRATMTLRARDLRPMREMLEFTGQTVEVDDAPDETTPAIITPPVVRQLAASPSRPAKEAVAPQATLHGILQVFSTLHRLGADLGEPVEIRQNAGRADLTAIGLTITRQEQLRKAFESIPNVSLHFASDSSRGTAQRPERPASKLSPANGSRAQTRLETMLGSTQAAEALTDRALDASDAVLARVHALRALAKAFPPQQEVALSPPDQRLLTSLRVDHFTVLTRKIAELRSTLQPVTSAPLREPTGTSEIAPWQEKVVSLFVAAQNLDEALNRALAGNVAGATDFAVVSRAMAQLEKEESTLTGR